MRDLLGQQPLHLTGICGSVPAQVVHVSGSQRQCANAIERIAGLLQTSKVRVPPPPQLTQVDRDALIARIAQLRI
jgi:hypothetical protein